MEKTELTREERKKKIEELKEQVKKMKEGKSETIAEIVKNLENQPLPEDIEREIQRQAELINSIPDLHLKIESLKKLVIEEKTKNIKLIHNVNLLGRINRNLKNILSSITQLKPYLSSEAGLQVQKDIESLMNLSLEN